MRLVISLFGTIKETASLIMDELKPEYVCVIGELDKTKALDLYRFPEGCEVEIIPYWDNRLGIYEDVSWNELEPLDEPMIKSMLGAEAEVMEMMDRDVHLIYYKNQLEHNGDPNDIALQFQANKYFTSELKYSRRKRLYYRHLRYWNDFLSKRNIDLSIWGSIPHVANVYVMHQLAERRGIKSLMLGHTSIPSYKVAFEDYRANDLEVKKLFEEYRSKEMTSEEIDKDMPEIALSEYERLSADAKEQIKPWYLDKVTYDPNIGKVEEGVHAKQESLIQKLKKLFDPDYLHLRLKGRHKTEVWTQKFFDWYESMCGEVDLKEPFVFVPLHLQPENTTSPMGGRFVDQLLMIQILSYAAPKNWKIYVKEHFNQKLICRTPEFYHDLNALPNVKLISRSAESYPLIQNAKAIAGVTSTAGWEGQFKNKAFLMFGHHVNLFGPGTFPVKSVKDAQEAFDIIASGVDIQKSDIKLFMKSICEAGVFASKFRNEQKFTGVDFDEGQKRLADLYLDRYYKMIAS